MSSCPSSILNASIDDKLHYYKHDVIVNHRSISETVDLIDHKANDTLDRRLIFLVGGTGVGKTAALMKAIERRNNRRKDEICNRPDIVPAICIEAEAPDKGEYSFDSLYLDGLVALKTPLAHRTLPLINRAANDRQLMTLAIERFRQIKSEEGALKMRFRSALLARETELVGIDEALHVFTTGQPKSEKDRLNRIKSQANKLKTLTNKTPAALVLTGAYDFFEATLSSGQNARRSVIIHMEPYPKTSTGIKDFLTALVGLVAHLPISHDLNISEHCLEIFLQALGCVGIAKEIFCEALLLAFRSNETMSIKHIRLAYYPSAQLNVMRAELEFGINTIREVTSLESLARPAISPLIKDTERNSIHKLKPGETTPSHRKGISAKW